MVAGMQIGVVLPQGWTGESTAGASRAWERTVAVARQAESWIRVDWVFDHFQTVPEPIDELTFESFTRCPRGRRSPARAHRPGRSSHRFRTMPSRQDDRTMDVISGGRMELGSGAAGRKDEWLAYGTAIPARGTAWRCSATISSDHPHAGPDMPPTAHPSVRQRRDQRARGLQQPRVPSWSAATGEVTWRWLLAMGELNLDWLGPEEVRKPAGHRVALRGDRRDPATLRLSVNIGRDSIKAAGAKRVDLLAGYREVGVSRVMTLLQESATGDDALELLARDAAAAGLTLHKR